MAHLAAKVPPLILAEWNIQRKFYWRGEKLYLATKRFEIGLWPIRYPELALTCHALYHVESARSWLLAMVSLISWPWSGVQKAMRVRLNGWINSVTITSKMSPSAPTTTTKLSSAFATRPREWAGIALKIRAVKNQIEADNNDMHRISRT